MSRVSTFPKITRKTPQFGLMNHLHGAGPQFKLQGCNCSRCRENEGWSWPNWPYYKFFCFIIIQVVLSPQSTDEVVLYTEQTSCICPSFQEVSRDSSQRKGSILLNLWFGAKYIAFRKWCELCMHRRTCSRVGIAFDLKTVCLRFDSGHVPRLFLFFFSFFASYSQRSSFSLYDHKMSN